MAVARANAAPADHLNGNRLALKLLLDEVSVLKEQFTIAHKEDVMKGALIRSGLSLAGMLIITGCGMHHHSKFDLLRSTNVSLIEAVRAAETSVTNARTVEAELEREDGRIVYEVKMIDGAQQKHKVYVDAATGKIIKLN